MRTLGLKANRLALQQAQFESLIEKGYKRENYGDLSIFTMTDDISTWLKVFRATASKEIEFKRYKTLEQTNKKIADLKVSHDRRKAYKAELKSNPTKSCSANCATAIREELKKDFPNVKFSVKSSNFANGDSVHISWTDGPTTLEVSKITSKYQYGRFDGMTDIYEYSNTIENLPQSKYVQTRREISEEVNNIVKEAVRKLFNFSNMTEWEQEREINSYAYKIINKNSIPVGATVTGIAEGEEGVFFEDRHPLTFLLPTTAERKTKTETVSALFEKVEVVDSEIQIIDYSEKAIAVIGDTKPIKEKLKELGGKFNFRLSCGAGWIFPKSKLNEIEKLLTA